MLRPPPAGRPAATGGNLDHAYNFRARLEVIKARGERPEQVQLAK